jgi:hypothetical protein
MKTVLLLLIVAVAGAGGCSKSSSANADKTKVATKPSDIADITVASSCEDTCTKVGLCYEQFYKGESFKGGGGCVEACEKMAATERADYAKEVTDAVRNNNCAALFEEADAADEEGDTAVEQFAQATIAMSDSKLGCFAWSETLPAAACVVGHSGSTGNHTELQFLGRGAPAALPLVDSGLGGSTTVDKPHATKADDVLAKHQFKPLADDAVSPLIVKKPKDMQGATLRFTKNPSPLIVAACNGKTTEVFHTDGEGETATANVRPLGSGFVLVEVSIHTAREGEFDDAFEAVLLDAASCTLVK